MHPGASCSLDVAFLCVGAKAADVRALVQVSGVVATLFDAFNDALCRLDPIKYWHTEVHENELVGPELPPGVQIKVALFDDLDRLVST